jgi:hypothetical protein
MTAKLLFLFIAASSIYRIAAAQKFPASPDSISDMVCKKWTLDHLVYMGITVPQTKSGTDIRLTFRPDSTAECVSVYKGKTTDIKGKWVWDSAHVDIMLLDPNGSNYFHVTSLGIGALSGFMVSYKSAKMSFIPDTTNNPIGTLPQSPQ